jgi:phosphoribosyl-AMP cyclohydrolase
VNLPIDFEANPLVPVVIQDDESRDVLMVGFMNQLAFERTQETGLVHFWSRSRGKLWKKGESSGHTQQVVSMSVNCEDNSLLIQAIQNGAVCHTGHRTCYYRQVLPDGTLFETSDPVFDPDEVYGVDNVARSGARQNLGDAQDNAAWSIGAWYGAYEYLRDNDLTAVSNTSRLLHATELPFDRIAGEMDELAGVLAGEHSHSDDITDDLLLEGSQVLYWLTVCSVSLTLHWDRNLGLHNSLIPSFAPDRRYAIAELRAMANKWRRAEEGLRERDGTVTEDLLENLRESYWIVASAVSTEGAVPLAMLDLDLAELRSKDYLSGYFASLGG